MKSKFIEIPFQCVIKWQCPQCKKNRQQTFFSLPRKYTCLSQLTCNCGTQPLEFGDIVMYGRIREEQAE